MVAAGAFSLRMMWKASEGGGSVRLCLRGMRRRRLESGFSGSVVKRSAERARKEKAWEPAARWRRRGETDLVMRVRARTAIWYWSARAQREARTVRGMEGSILAEGLRRSDSPRKTGRESMMRSLMWGFSLRADSMK